jgi:pyrimidine operon attenuation protein/uracil phosphoribosyltransferase
MTKSSSLILDNESVNKKIDRITHQIIEENFNEKELIIIGISKNGFLLAEKITKLLNQLNKSLNVELTELHINKNNPLKNSIEIKPNLSCENKKVILIDDVLNSGRTLMHAAAYFINLGIKKMNTIVLVDRRHRLFPIKADWVGLTLSTTIQEHIRVDFKKGNILVYLE